jgi:hypothetical protein
MSEQATSIDQSAFSVAERVVGVVPLLVTHSKLKIANPMNTTFMVDQSGEMECNYAMIHHGYATNNVGFLLRDFDCVDLRGYVVEYDCLFF